MAEDLPFIDIFKENAVTTKKTNFYGLKREIRFISERIVVEYSPDETLSVREVIHPLSPFRTPDPYFSFKMTQNDSEYVTSIDFHDHAPYFPYAKSTGEINLLRYINNFNDKNFAKISNQSIMRLQGQCIDKLRHGKLDKGFVATYYHTHGQKNQSTLSVIDLVDPESNITHFDTNIPLNDLTWTWYNEVTLAACDDNCLRVIDIRTPRSYGAVFFNGGLQKMAVNCMRMGEITGWDGEHLLLFDIRRLDVPVKQHSIKFPNGDSLSDIRYNVYLPKQLFIHTKHNNLYSTNFDEIELFTSKHVSEEVVDDTERITFKNIDRGVYTQRMKYARRREFEMTPKEVVFEDYSDHYESAKIDEKVKMPLRWTSPYVYSSTEVLESKNISAMTAEYNTKRIRERCFAEHIYQLDTPKFLYTTINVETFDFTLPGVNGILFIRSDKLEYELIVSPLHYEGSSCSDVSIDAISEMRKVQVREMIPSHMLYLMSSRLDSGWNAFNCQEPNLHELIMTVTSNESQFWCDWLRNSAHLQYSGNEFVSFSPKSSFPRFPEVMPNFKIASYKKSVRKNALQDALRISAPFYRLFLSKPVPDVKHGKINHLTTLYPSIHFDKVISVRKKNCIIHKKRHQNLVRYIENGEVILAGRGNDFVSVFRRFNLKRADKKTLIHIKKKSQKIVPKYPYFHWEEIPKTEHIEERDDKAEELKAEEEKKKKEEEEKKKEEEKKSKTSLSPPPPANGSNKPPANQGKRFNRLLPPPPPPPPKSANAANNKDAEKGQQKEEVKLIVASQPRPLFRYRAKRIDEKTMIEMLKKSMTRTMKVKREKAFNTIWPVNKKPKLAKVNQQRLFDLKMALNRSKRLGWHALYQKNFLDPEKCSYSQLLTCLANLYNDSSRPRLGKEKIPSLTGLYKKRLAEELESGRKYIHKPVKFSKLNTLPEESSESDSYDADSEDEQDDHSYIKTGQFYSEPEASNSANTLFDLCSNQNSDFVELMRIANEKLVSNKSTMEYSKSDRALSEDIRLIICDWKSPLITEIDKKTGEVKYQKVVPVEEIRHLRTYLRYGYDEILPASAESDYWTLHHFNHYDYVHPFFVYSPPYSLHPSKGKITGISEFKIKGMKLSEAYLNVLQKTFYGRYFPLTIPRLRQRKEKKETILPWEKVYSPSRRRRSKDLRLAEAKQSSKEIISQKISWDAPPCQDCIEEGWPSKEICCTCQDEPVKFYNCTVIQTMVELCEECDGPLLKLRCSNYGRNWTKSTPPKRPRIMKRRKSKKSFKNSKKSSRRPSRGKIDVVGKEDYECDKHFVQKCFEDADEKDLTLNQDPLLSFFYRRTVDCHLTRDLETLEENQMHDEAFEESLKRDSVLEEKKKQAAIKHAETQNKNETGEKELVVWYIGEERKEQWIYSNAYSRFQKKIARDQKKYEKEQAKKLEAMQNLAPPQPPTMQKSVSVTKTKVSPKPKKTASKEKNVGNLPVVPPKANTSNSIDQRREKFVKDFTKLQNCDGTNQLQRAVIRRNLKHKCKELRKKLELKKFGDKSHKNQHRKHHKKKLPRVPSCTAQERALKQFTEEIQRDVERKQIVISELTVQEKVDFVNCEIMKRKERGAVKNFSKKFRKVLKKDRRMKRLARRRNIKRDAFSMHVKWANPLNLEVIQVVKKKKQDTKYIKKRKSRKTKLDPEQIQFMEDIMHRRVNDERFRMQNGEYILPDAPKRGCFRRRKKERTLKRRLTRRQHHRRIQDSRKRDEQLGKKPVEKPMTNLQSHSKDVKSRLTTKLAKYTRRRLSNPFPPVIRKRQIKRQTKVIFRKPIRLCPPLSPLLIPLSIHWPVEEHGLTVGRTFLAPNVVDIVPISPEVPNIPIPPPVKESAFAKFKSKVMPFLRPMSAVFTNRRNPAANETTEEPTTSDDSVLPNEPSTSTETRDLLVRRNTTEALKRKPTTPINIRPLPKGYFTQGSSAEDVAAMLDENDGWWGDESPPLSQQPEPQPEPEPQEAFSAPAPIILASPETLAARKKKENTEEESESDDGPILMKTTRSATLPNLLEVMGKKKKDKIKMKLDMLTSIEQAKKSLSEPFEVPTITMPTPLFIGKLYQKRSVYGLSKVDVSDKKSMAVPKRYQAQKCSKILNTVKRVIQKPFTKTMILKYLEKNTAVIDNSETFRTFLLNYPFVYPSKRKVLQCHNATIREKIGLDRQKYSKKFSTIVRTAFPLKDDRFKKQHIRERNTISKQYEQIFKTLSRKSRKIRRKRMYCWRKRKLSDSSSSSEEYESESEKQAIDSRRKLRRYTISKFTNIDKMRPIPKYTKYRKHKNRRRKVISQEQADLQFYNRARRTARHAMQLGRRTGNWKLYRLATEKLKNWTTMLMNMKNKERADFDRNLRSIGVVIKLDDQKKHRVKSQYHIEPKKLLKKIRVIKKKHLSTAFMKKRSHFSAKFHFLVDPPNIPEYDDQVKEILHPEKDTDIDLTTEDSEYESDSEYAESDHPTFAEVKDAKYWRRQTEQSTYNIKGLPGLLYLARLVQERVGEHMEPNLPFSGAGFKLYKNTIQVSPIRRLMLVSIGCKMPDRFKRINLSDTDLGQSLANVFSTMCYGHGDYLREMIELIHRMIGFPVCEYEIMDDAYQAWILTKLYRKMITIQSGAEARNLAKLVKDAISLTDDNFFPNETGESYQRLSSEGVPWSMDDWIEAADQFLSFAKKTPHVRSETIACVCFLRMVMTNGYSGDIVDEIIDLTLPIREKLTFIINLSPHSQIVRNTLRLFQRVNGLDRLPFVGLGYHKDSLAVLHEEAVLNGDCQLAAHLLVIGQCLDDRSEEAEMPEIGSDHIHNRDIGEYLENIFGCRKELGPKTLQEAFPISYIRDAKGNKIDKTCDQLSKMLECEVSKYLAVLEVLKGSSYLDRTCNHIDRLQKYSSIFPTEIACTQCHVPLFKGTELANLGEEMTLASISEQLKSQRNEVSSRNCKFLDIEDDLKPYPVPSAGGDATQKVEEELQNRSADHSCQNCRRPLPRCTICMSYYLTNMSDLEWAEDNVDKNFAVCYLCNHGGHVRHLVEWFEEEIECPVSQCRCRCASVQPSILKKTQIRESMIQSSNMRARTHICNPKCASDPNCQ